MTTTDLIIIDSSSQIEPPCIVYIYHEIYLQNWLIYGVNVGKYSSTMGCIWVSSPWISRHRHETITRVPVIHISLNPIFSGYIMGIYPLNLDLYTVNYWNIAEEWTDWTQSVWVNWVGICHPIRQPTRQWVQQTGENLSPGSPGRLVWCKKSDEFTHKDWGCRCLTTWFDGCFTGIQC